MFQRFHEMREDRDDRGFTLIELLVVVLIIAVLAAIAIPFFLNQRQRSWESQAQSALKNAATSMESHAAQFDGTYPAVDTAPPLDQLTAQGYKATDGVTVTIERSGANYCLKAVRSGITSWEYEGGIGKPVEDANACT